MNRLTLAVMVAAVALCGEAKIPTEPTLVLDLPPSADNCRNSEGDFIRLKDGGIMLVYSHYLKGTGDDGDHAVLASRFSWDGGLTWSKDDGIIVANEGTQNVMCVSLLRRKDGSIALFYIRKNSDLDCRPLMRISRDEGRTWAKPIAVIPDSEIGYYVLENHRVERLKSGRLAMAMSVHAYLGSKEPGFSCWLVCYVSDDDGLTWRRSQKPWPVLDGEGKRVTVQEPGLIELKDGRVMLYARTDRGRQWFFYSSDECETWTKGEPGSLFGPLAPAKIIRLRNGDLLAFWNDHERYPQYAKAGPKWAFGARTPCTLGISRDEGKTWPARLDIEADPNGWYCYPAILEMDGYLLVEYVCVSPSDPKKSNLERSVVKLVPIDCIK